MMFKKSLLATTLVTLFTVTACGGGSSKKDEPVTPSNTAPTDITISASSVDENAAGVEIGTLTATDANAGDTFTFVVDNELFIVDGSKLMLAADKQVNFEQAASHTVNVTVTDNGGLSFTKELTIEVNDVIDTYTFASKFEDGSSVSYSGQIARHVLIAELNNYIGSTLKTEVEEGIITTRQQVIDKLNKFFRTTEEQYDNFPITFTSGAKQAFITEISGSHKNLKGKLAGNDATGQHKNWNEGDFAGWGTQGDYTPESLVDFFFGQLADNVDYYLTVGNDRVSDTGATITEFYINTDGTDLKQLIQKFLLMAVAYSQATDDYFGHEIEGKGFTTDNTGAVSGKAYTNLEHQFDEGFGYFGAARDYMEYNDNEIAGKVSSDEDGRADWNGKHDTDGDGEIDLTSEYNFGNSVNAAKRDRGTKSNTNPTDYTTDAMTALIAGRTLINENAGHALTDEQMTSLKGYRDQAVSAWEKAVAATVVHYINEVSGDLAKLGSEEFNYANTAKHWSELKGFALGLQFNPYSPINDEQFAELHQLIGQAPVLDSTTVNDYLSKLESARDILEQALEFDSENVENW